MFKSLIHKTHSKAISFNKQFCISMDEHFEENDILLFQPPSSSVITRRVESIGAFVHFTINNSERKELDQINLEIHHITEYLQDVSERNFIYEGCCFHVYILGNSALFVVKRINDYLYAQIFNYESAEDLLYYIQACFTSLKLDNSLDKLVLCGDIKSDSKIANLLSIYLSNLIIDSTKSLSSISR